MGDSNLVDMQWNRQAGGFTQDELDALKFDRQKKEVAEAAASAQDKTPPAGVPMRQAGVDRFFRDVYMQIPPGNGTVDGGDPIDEARDLAEKVEDYCSDPKDAGDRGSATGRALGNFATYAAALDPDVLKAAGVPIPDSYSALKDLAETLEKEGRDPTEAETDGALGYAIDWIDDAADKGVVDKNFAAGLKTVLGAARETLGGARPAEGAGDDLLANGLGTTFPEVLGEEKQGTVTQPMLTTSDIMELIAQVLSATARNANEMRLQESKASLSSIQESLALSEQAAKLKVEAAEKQKEASVQLAIGQLVSGISDLVGGVGGVLASFRNKPELANLLGQTGRGIGTGVEAIFKTRAAAFQYESSIANASAELAQAYGQQASAIGQRAQSSAQDQGAVVRSTLDTLTALVNALNQTLIGMAQNTGK